jgi:hypothetical protein
MVAFINFVRRLLVGLVLLPLPAMAGETPTRYLPGSGLAVPDTSAGPQDAEAQIREIERTKKLMRALGEMHGGEAAPKPGTQPAVAPSAVPAAPAASARQEAAAAPAIAPLSHLPAAELREIAGTAREAARAVGIAGDKPVAASMQAERSLPVQEQSRSRSRPSDDGQEFRALLDGFVDEVLPWVIGFGLLFIAAYSSYGWFAGRATRQPRASGHSSTRRSSSERSRSGRHSREGSRGSRHGGEESPSRRRRQR